MTACRLPDGRTIVAATQGHRVPRARRHRRRDPHRGVPAAQHAAAGPPQPRGTLLFGGTPTRVRGRPARQGPARASAGRLAPQLPRCWRNRTATGWCRRLRLRHPGAGPRGQAVRRWGGKPEPPGIVFIFSASSRSCATATSSSPPGPATAPTTATRGSRSWSSRRTGRLCGSGTTPGWRIHPRRHHPRRPRPGEAGRRGLRAPIARLSRRRAGAGEARLAAIFRTLDRRRGAFSRPWKSRGPRIFSPRPVKGVLRPVVRPRPYQGQSRPRAETSERAQECARVRSPQGDHGGRNGRPGGPALPCQPGGSRGDRKGRPPAAALANRRGSCIVEPMKRLLVVWH